MFSLSICMGSVVWAFRYKDTDKADQAFETVRQATAIVTVTDEFGQTATFNAEKISGVMLEDMKKSREAHIEQMLHNSSMQQEAQKRANTRPQSPSIVSPFPR